MGGCTASVPIAYTGEAAVKRDIDNLRAALAGTEVVDAFLPVAAPASVIPDRKNEFFRDDEECLAAIADAMRTEYRLIVDFRFPAAARRCPHRGDLRSHGAAGEFLPTIGIGSERYIEVLNHALDGIPEHRVRYHVCWGSWPGPHTSDVPLKDIVDLILKVRAGGYVIEGANPRHEHEWTVWRDVKLPSGKVLIPGVISHATNIVEHPQLVCERIVRLARLVGRENVIASTDCGFAQSPTYRRVHPSIMWAKLEALAEGARLATQELWA